MSLLEQCRDSWTINICENGSIALWSYIAQVDNGFGTMIDDPAGKVVTKKERVRLSHESLGVTDNAETPAGLGTSYSMFVAMMWNSVIAENDVITVDGQKWKVGAVDTLRKAGGIYGKQAPLTKVS